MKRQKLCCTQCKETICDTCGQNLDMYDIKLMEAPIKLNYCGTGYDFCNFNCLLKFIVEESKKEK